MGRESHVRRRNRRQLVILVVVLLVAAAVWVMLDSSPHSGNSIQATFLRPDKSTTPTFQLEVAHTPDGRARGLMYRRPNEIPVQHGMIFVFPEEREHSFWMRNTYTSLDMIFLDKELKVVGVLHDVPVLNDEPRKVGKDSMYVVELPAGNAHVERIEEGATLLPQVPLPRGE